MITDAALMRLWTSLSMLPSLVMDQIAKVFLHAIYHSNKKKRKIRVAQGTSQSGTVDFGTPFRKILIIGCDQNFQLIHMLHPITAT